MLVFVINVGITQYIFELFYHEYRTVYSIQNPVGHYELSLINPNKEFVEAFPFPLPSDPLPSDYIYLAKPPQTSIVVPVM